MLCTKECSFLSGTHGSPNFEVIYFLDRFRNPLRLHMWVIIRWVLHLIGYVFSDMSIVKYWTSASFRSNLLRYQIDNFVICFVSALYVSKSNKLIGAVLVFFPAISERCAIPQNLYYVAIRDIFIATIFKSASSSVSQSSGIFFWCLRRTISNRSRRLLCGWFHDFETTRRFDRSPLVISSMAKEQSPSSTVPRTPVCHGKNWSSGSWFRMGIRSCCFILNYDPDFCTFWKIVHYIFPPSAVHLEDLHSNW